MTKISSIEINDLFLLFKFDDKGTNSSVIFVITSPHHGLTSSYNFNITSIIMTKTTLIEKQIANLTKMLEELTKGFREKDAQIASLTTKLENATGKALMDATIDLPKTQVKERSTSITKTKGDS